MSGELIRLKVYFVLVGVALLAPLALLWRSAEARFEEQRQVRHEVVAERVLDEMQRELTAIHAREAARPSSDYYASTSPERWNPWVVGYFTVDSAQPRLLAESDLTPRRAARVRAAVAALEPGSSAPAEIEEEHAPVQALRPAEQAPSRPRLQRKVVPEVIRQLNRGREEQKADDYRDNAY